MHAAPVQHEDLGKRDTTISDLERGAAEAGVACSQRQRPPSATVHSFHTEHAADDNFRPTRERPHPQPEHHNGYRRRSRTTRTTARRHSSCCSDTDQLEDDNYSLLKSANHFRRHSRTTRRTPRRPTTAFADTRERHANGSPTPTTAHDDTENVTDGQQTEGCTRRDHPRGPHRQRPEDLQQHVKLFVTCGRHREKRGTRRKEDEGRRQPRVRKGSGVNAG